jgi:hypothetical protein
MEVLKDGIPDEAFKSSEYAINRLFRIFDALDRHKGQIVLAARGLDKTVMRALTKDSAWVDGHSASCLRAAALLRELALARADGSLRHFLARADISGNHRSSCVRNTEISAFWERSGNPASFQYHLN